MAQHTTDKALWEEKGEPMGFRVLPDEGKGQWVEVSARQQGKFAGEDCTTLLTYRFTTEPDGTLRGAGQGISYLKDGSMTTWSSQGEGKQGAPGGSQNWEVTLNLRNTSGRFVEHKDKLFIGTYEIDEAWKSKGKLFPSK
jgi:hypothetical protein